MSSKKKKTDSGRRSFLKAGMFSVFVWIAAATLPWPLPAHASDTERNILVVYYSRTGNTRTIAQYIQAIVGGDISELIPAQAYPAGNIEAGYQATRELASGYLPPLATSVSSIAAYDVIFIGSPSWWGTLATPVRTFLSAHDFSGKILAPFITHEGSGLGKTVSALETFCPNSTILEGLDVPSRNVGTARPEVAQWLRKLGFLH